MLTDLLLKYQLLFLPFVDLWLRLLEASGVQLSGEAGGL